MNHKKRRSLRLGTALLLSICAPNAAQASRILAVRTWPSAEYTRVTIENNDELKTTFLLLKDPYRLVVDIENLQLDQTLKELVAKVKPNDPYIEKIRIGQNRPDVVRLVFDLKSEVVPQVFTLKPAGKYQYRLIFDLYPPVGSTVTPQADALDEFTAADAAKSAKSQTSESSTDKTVVDKVEAEGVVSKNGVKEHDVQPEKTTKHNNARRVVVLDPGHGGEDPGAIGAKGTYEKDIVLQIAKKLRKELLKLPDIDVVLTRDEDFFVPLKSRVQKARKARADLFISIHADAFVEPRARGSSVFVLSQKGASSAAARWLANKENESDLIGGAHIKVRDIQIAKVLLDLSTTAQINDSLKLGKSVLREISHVNHLHKDHVEHAGFAVLKAPDVPSILIETAFISNPSEEQKLASSEYQVKLAKAIADGVREYFGNA